MFKKLIIAGGTGFLGKLLINRFREEYDEIVVLTRKRSIGEERLRFVHWDGKSMTGWEKELEGADVLINLTGKCVDCRYNEENKAQILESRLASTKVLQKAIQECVYPPEVWLNASSATIYKEAFEEDQDELKGILGNTFSEEVCKKWERSFFKVKDERIRKVALRIGIVISNKGGGYPKMKSVIQKGIYRFGSGRQMMSWIHEEDFVNAIQFLIEKREVSGCINITSPKPLPNTEFLKEIREYLETPSLLPLQKWVLEFGAFFMKTETELILKSRRVIPRRLLDEGFRFKYENWKNALRYV